MTSRVLLFIIFVLSSALHAFQSDSEEMQFYRSRYLVTLQGEQENTYPKNNYITVEDVLVRRGAVMTLTAGSTIYFKANTRFIIEGTLQVEGTAESPVRFVKLDSDNYYKPLKESQPNFWDGIFISEGGSAVLRNTEISGSKYGIETDPGLRSLILENVTFTENRYCNLKTNGIIVDKSAHAILNYPPETAESAKPDSVEHVKAALSTRTVLRFSSALFTTAALGYGTYGLVKYFHNSRLYNEETSDAEKVNRYEDNWISGRTAAMAGFSCAAAGLTGFLLTFSF